MRVLARAVDPDPTIDDWRSQKAAAMALETRLLFNFLRVCAGRPVDRNTSGL